MAWKLGSGAEVHAFATRCQAGRYVVWSPPPFHPSGCNGSYTVPDYRQFQYGYFESGCRSERTKNTGRRCGRESGGSILHKEALKNDK